MIGPKDQEQVCTRCEKSIKACKCIAAPPDNWDHYDMGKIWCYEHGQEALFLYEDKTQYQMCNALYVYQCPGGHEIECRVDSSD